VKADGRRHQDCQEEVGANSGPENPIEGEPSWFRASSGGRTGKKERIVVCGELDSCPTGNRPEEDR